MILREQANWRRGGLLLAVVVAVMGTVGGVTARNVDGDGREVESAQEVGEGDSKPKQPLNGATEAERKVIERLLADQSWSRRAMGVMRLERFDCKASEGLLAARLSDAAWQVRAFAVRGLGVRRAKIEQSFFDEEQEPRVVRTGLRFRYEVDKERIARGARFLARSNQMKDVMLAAELALAMGAAGEGDEAMMKLGEESLRRVVLRMGRAEAGMLSPRIAAISNSGDLRRGPLFQRWMNRNRKELGLHGAFAVTADGEVRTFKPKLAMIDGERFVSVDQYLQTLGERSMDLAIVIDCTASMYGELAEAQGGIDDLMLFARDLLAGFRVGVVAYRDRRNEFETKAMDFTSEIEAARGWLWSLSADQGGDTPEMVYEALLAAFTGLTWKKEHTRVVVLVGDAPPHVGTGAHCVALAEQGARTGFTTHAIQAAGKPVKHFPEIAKAGNGRCVDLQDSDSLVGEITGLTLGDRFNDEFAELFRVYLELCR